MMNDDDDDDDDHDDDHHDDDDEFDDGGDEHRSYRTNTVAGWGTATAKGKSFKTFFSKSSDRIAHGTACQKLHKCRKMLAVALTLTLAVLLFVDWSYRFCPTESDPHRYEGVRCIIRKRLILWKICLVVFSLVISRCYIISNHESSSSESMWVACFHHVSWCFTIHSTLGEKPGKQKKHCVILP